MATIERNLSIVNNVEYDEYASRWATVRAFNDGEPKLKQFDLMRAGGSSNRVSFLRRINPSDTSDYNKENNIDNINGAVLFNTVVKTRSGLLGMLYRKPPAESELPESIRYIYKNVDGSGLSMVQQSRSVSSDVVSIGRDGLLTDMPRNDEGVQITQSDVNNGFRASIQEYKAESIIDWHESIINNVKVLDELWLCEQITTLVPGTLNTREIKNQYKAYRLSSSGVTVQTYTDSEDGKGLGDSEEVIVTDSSGAALTMIPFVFVGSKNNQSKVDNLPLEPIALVNKGHYQESANLAGSSFQLSACQPVISDTNYSRMMNDPRNKGKVELGPNSAMVLSSEGSFALVAPPPNPLAKSIQDGYKEQMIELGAQLIAPNGGVETAEAARLKHASDVSDLEVISENISSAYTKSLEHVCMFMGVEYKEEYTFKLNSEFFEVSLTADEALKWVQTWQGGAMSKSELDTIMVKGKAIGADVDLDLMNKNIEDNSPSVNLDE